MKVTKNKKYIITGGVIIAVAIGGRGYYMSKHLNKPAGYSEVKNMKAADLTATLSDALKVINKAQQTGDWSLDMVKNLNNRLIQVQARLNMQEDIGDLSTLINTFKQCDSTLYSLSFDEVKDADAYNEQLEGINKEADKTRGLLKIKDDGNYFRERTLNALNIQCDALSKLDGSKLRTDDALSVGKNLERLYDVEGGDFSTETCETLAKMKPVLAEAYAKASDKKVKETFNMVDDMLINYCSNTKGTPSYDALMKPIREGAVAVNTGVSSQGTGVGVIPSDKNTYNLKYFQPREITLPDDYNIAAGIKVLYGKHYYGCKTQEEYDTVVKIMQDKVLSKPKFDNEFAKGMERFANGERASDYDKYSDYEIASDTALGDAVGEIRTFDDIWGKLIYQLDPDFRDKFMSDYSLYYSRFLEVCQDATSPDGSFNPNSAYHELVTKVSDCDSWSNTEILLFDMLGYNTRITTNESRSHTEAEVQVLLIDGTTAWLNIGGLDAYQDKANIWTPETKSDSTARPLDDDL